MSNKFKFLTLIIIACAAKALAIPSCGDPINAISTSQQTYTSSSSSSKVENVLGILKDLNNHLPLKVLDNLYVISSATSKSSAEITMKLTNGDSFIKSSIDFAVLNMVGYICSDCGLSESEAKNNNITVKAVLLNNANKVLYKKDMSLYDCIAFYNRQNSSSHLEENLSSFQQFARDLNKETPQTLTEGVVITSVEMIGKKMVFNHSISRQISMFIRQGGYTMKKQLDEIMLESCRNFYPAVKDVIGFMEKEGIDFRYRLYEEGTKSLIYEVIITPQDLKTIN